GRGPDPAGQLVRALAGAGDQLVVLARLQAMDREVALLVDRHLDRSAPVGIGSGDNLDEGCRWFVVVGIEDAPGQDTAALGGEGVLLGGDSVAGGGRGPAYPIIHTSRRARRVRRFFAEQATAGSSQVAAA